MFEAFVQLHCRFLQLHARRETVRPLGAPTDEAINLFFDVEQRLFHVAGNPSNARGANLTAPVPAGLRLSQSKNEFTSASAAKPMMDSGESNRLGA